MDHQIQIFDKRRGEFDRAACLQFGYRALGSKPESRYSRGSAHFNLFVKGYIDGTVRLFDYRNVQVSAPARIIQGYCDAFRTCRRCLLECNGDHQPKQSSTRSFRDRRLLRSEVMSLIFGHTTHNRKTRCAYGHQIFRIIRHYFCSAYLRCQTLYNLHARCDTPAPHPDNAAMRTNDNSQWGINPEPYAIMEPLQKGCNREYEMVRRLTRA